MTLQNILQKILDIVLYKNLEWENCIAISQLAFFNNFEVIDNWLAKFISGVR